MSTPREHFTNELVAKLSGKSAPTTKAEALALLNDLLVAEVHPVVADVVKALESLAPPALQPEIQLVAELLAQLTLPVEQAAEVGCVGCLCPWLK